MKNLLLISNSVTYGKGYLDHVESEIVDFLGNIKTILFIPYALNDRDRYTAVAKKRFGKMGINLASIHEVKNPQGAVKKAQAIFIGGGNTFRLLNELYKNKLLDVIRKRVEEGTPYIGSSAGSNVAAPTIKTTNDMPIVELPSFKALNLVSFQINPHYIDKNLKSKHMGETREERIKEFLEENDTTVVGLREGSWLRIKNKQIELRGAGGAKIFKKGQKPKEYSSQLIQI